MSLVHAKSLTVTDQTGTVTVGPWPNTSTMAATDNARPVDWNSAHIFSQTLGGNTAGSALLTGTNLVLAGGNNITLSASQGTNGEATISIVGGAAGAASINFSAGTTSGSFSAVTFANGSNVSFGLNAGVITGSVATSLTAVNVSAGTTSNNLSAMVFSNSNNVSFGINGSTITATATFAGGAGNTLSFFANYQVVTNTVGSTFNDTAAFIAPFVMPDAISFDSLRMYVAMQSAGNSTAATSVNTTVSNEYVASLYLAFYTQNTGASSASLSQLMSTSASSRISWRISANANGSEFTVTNGITYPYTGGTSSFSTTYASTNASFQQATSVMSRFSGSRFLDFGFSTSLAASNYWIAHRHVSTTAGNGGVPTRLSLAPQFFSGLVAVNEMGQAANAVVCALPGQGIFSTDASISSLIPAIVMANVTRDAGGMPLFYMARSA